MSLWTDCSNKDVILYVLLSFCFTFCHLSFWHPSIFVFVKNIYIGVTIMIAWLANLWLNSHCVLWLVGVRLCIVRVYAYLLLVIMRQIFDGIRMYVLETMQLYSTYFMEDSAWVGISVLLYSFLFYCPQSCILCAHSSTVFGSHFVLHTQHNNHRARPSYATELACVNLQFLCISSIIVYHTL